MARVRRTAAHPWLILGSWVLVVAALALLGMGIADRLAPSSLQVPGSPSARAEAMLKRQFGESVAVTILLQGPSGAIDREGPRLAAALRHEGRVKVMSPWNSGTQLGALRPRPTAALIVASFQRPQSEAMSEIVPDAQRLVDENVRPPLRAHLGGVAAIATALQENALQATHHAEILVVPILIVVLLFVFRTPVAAAVPLLMGAATVLAGRGLLLLSTYAMPINSLAVAMASMMGLALGVDYALLMVSRFRQERDGGADVDTAIATAAHAAGRTIVFAGGTLAVAMLTAAVVAPGNLLGSVAAGVMVSALLSVLLAVSLMPALLRVLSAYLDRWRLPSPGRGSGLLDLAGRLIARPWIAIPLILLPMLAIAAPAGALSIGPPDPRQLPPSDPTRQGFEAMRRVIGPGWAAPIAVVATAREGVISEPGRLAAISRWQDRVAHQPGVAAVIGPASLQEAEGPIRAARKAYPTVPDRIAGAERGIAALRSGLRRASDGVAELRAGLGSAADGAAKIAGGTREAQDGASRLEAGLGRAGAGAHQLSSGLDSAVRGANRLVRGQRRLGNGAERLAHGVRQLDNSLRASLGQLQAVADRLRTWSAWIRSLRVPTEMAADRLERAAREVEAMTVGKEDPRYAQLVAAVREASALVGAPVAASTAGEPALPGGVASSLAAAIAEVEEQLARSVDSLGSMPGQLDRLASGVSRLRTGADQVAAGARTSERGGRELRAALRRLAHGSHSLDRGIETAWGGSGRLAGGLGTVASGADRLSSELRRGQARSGQLDNGLSTPQGPLSHYAVVLHGYQRGYEELQASSPRAIDSGYLMLTALDGTVPSTREQIEQVVNVDSGGQTVRMLVVPKSGPSSAATRRLSDRLQKELPALAHASDTNVGIGEGAQALADYTNATMTRIPWLVGALSIVCILMLILVVRSLPLPIVAVGLNLLTIAAAFGALQIFFGFDLLVGPRYIDAISAAGVLTIMFVLSIDYEVFLLTRMREAWLATGDHIHAIEHGLRNTAGVITGAAVIMSSVFLAFATTDIASLQQFGAGLTFAVVLDATVVRVVLLPTIMRMLGRRAWWMPAWLDRRLPVLDHGAGPAPAGAEAATGNEAGVGGTAIQEFGIVSHGEHDSMLELLDELEEAGAARDADRIWRLARELREIAEPHFHYEQRALFPRLAGVLGPERIESLYAEQDDVVAALRRIEALARPGRILESEAAEARRLVRAARASVKSCDAACEAVESQPEEVAKRVLAARERVLAAAG
jgi:putative drug exporter of the RND superfamily